MCEYVTMQSSTLYLRLRVNTLSWVGWIYDGEKNISENGDTFVNNVSDYLYTSAKLSCMIFRFVSNLNGNVAKFLIKKICKKKKKRFELLHIFFQNFLE